MVNNATTTDNTSVDIILKSHHLEETSHQRPVLLHIIDVQSRAIIGVQIDLTDVGDEARPSENA